MNKRQLSGDDNSSNSELKKSEEVLNNIEKKYNIKYRWSHTDREFVYYKSLMEQKQRLQLLSSLWNASRRRRFLLTLKAKYAG